jgi:hypothetical protein
VALSGIVALVRVAVQSAWNQIARSAGFGGKAVTSVMLVLVGAILILPGAAALRLGLGMGSELAKPGDPDMLRNWNALQATFTAGFAFLGSIRFKPAFPFSRFGRYPLTPLQLLAADLSAATFEVFPLLGVAAILLTNVGLAIRMPGAAPLVLLLALNGVLALLTTMILISALWAAIARSRVLTVAVAVALLAAVMAFSLGARGLRTVFKVWLPQFAQALPIARGYEGLITLRSGDLAAGLSGVAIAIGASVLLLAFTTVVHQRRLTRDTDAGTTRSGQEAPLRFDSPAMALGRLFRRQLLTSKAVRAQLVLPLLSTGTVAFFSSLIRSATAEGRVLPENLTTIAAKVAEFPWYAIVPFLAVAMNPQIWMNQFGWDRGGVRTLLLLPIDARDILLGKFRGLLGFTAIEITIGIVPLFTLRAPSPGEVVVALTAGGVALIVTTAVGHVTSFRFPRAIDGTAGLQIPMHLAWVSPVTLIVVGMGLTGLHALGKLIARHGGLVFLALALVGTSLAYYALLPRLAFLLRANRERLLTM